MHKHRLPLFLLGTTLCLSPALSSETADGQSLTNEPWSAYRFQREFCGEDKLEPFNRTMFGIFDWCMEWVVDPFCYVYSSIIPKPLIKGIDNFSENLEAPGRICSNLFMGEWLPAWDATRRCVINSTLGIGGLFDPAEDWFYIFESDASFSDTFAAWDVPAGPPLALPFMPRASVRGHVGYLVDYAFDVKTWFDYIVPSGCFIGWSWCLTPNKAPVWRGSWESLFHHTDDDYAVWMPVAAAMNDFNLRQFAWRYYESQYDRAYARMQAKQLPEGSAEREAKEAEAEKLFNDVRPPVHASATKPAGLKGEWRDIPGYAPRSPALDSLRALAFAPLGDDDFWWERRSLWCRDFSKSVDEREIVIRDDMPKATYSFVAQGTKHEAQGTKLVIVLPGIGAGRTASEAVAMAEFLHANGYAVVICDSIFHWEHVRSVNRGILPGYITEDAKRFADYLGRIVDDLSRNGLVATSDNQKPETRNQKPETRNPKPETRNPKPETRNPKPETRNPKPETRNQKPEVSVIGWSMGGLTVAHFAALDDRRELPVNVKRFIAINPPASMEHALAPFDPVFERSRRWTKADAHEMFVRAAPSLYGWASQDHPRYDPADPPLDTIGDPWNYAPNLTDEQAQFLLGLTLNTLFSGLVEQRHELEPFPWIKSRTTWFRRREFRDEIQNVSMREYIHDFVPHCYEGITPEQMIATATIRRLADALKHNAKFTVIHTWNDPLETDDDRRWFDETFGPRITWFADGGHCGYFYTRPFQDELLRHLSPLRDGVAPLKSR